MIVSLTTETMTAAPVTPSRGRLRPLGLTEVRITGGPWAQRQQVNGEATIPHIESWLERAGWLANFDYVVSGTVAERRRGRVFSDSEIYKLLEAMAWEIARTGDADLECRFRAVVKRVGAAQEAPHDALLQGAERIVAPVAFQSRVEVFHWQNTSVSG